MILIFFSFNSSDINENYNSDNDIKTIRKNLSKMKSGNLLKLFSRNLIEPKIYKEDMKIEDDSDSSNNYNISDDLCDYDYYKDEKFLENDNLLLYNADEFSNDKIENKENEKENNLNSFTILEVLKNKLSFDETLYIVTYIQIKK